MYSRHVVEQSSTSRSAAGEGPRGALEREWCVRLEATDAGSELVGATRFDDDLWLACTGLDAPTVLGAYRRRGVDALAALEGPFSFVLFDARRGLLVGARDALGERPLCYRRTETGIALATSPLELLEPASSGARTAAPALDDGSLARFFAVQAPRPGRTYFRDVADLPPGHLLVVEVAGSGAVGPIRSRRVWPSDHEPVFDSSLRHDDRAVVDRFRHLLTRAVHRRIEHGHTSVLMSGGLDSTSVAAFAARSDARLHAVSWVFDDFPGADERRWIHPTVEQLGLRADEVVGDRQWPLRQLDDWPIDPVAPWQGLYWWLQRAAYEHARDAGSRVLLTGEFGDHLFTERAFWLRDLLAARRLATAGLGVGRELVGILRGRPVGPLRAAASRALGWRGPATVPRPWLTREAAEHVAAAERAEAAAAPWPARERCLASPPLVDPMIALASALEWRAARRFGLELRRPYRDRALLDFVRAAPASLQYRPGESKWVLRRAVRGLLPEAVRRRRAVTSLLPLARRGLVDEEAATVRSILDAPDAEWPRYVRPEWLRESFPARLIAGRDGVEAVIAWQCVCFELWRRRLAEGGLVGEA
ncbi:MAG: asparagine synthase-related protein [Acidobacteriota bacterium]